MCDELLRDEAAWAQHRDLGQRAVSEGHNPALITAAYEEVYRRVLRR